MTKLPYLKVQADPRYKGRHTYHDSRFITTQDCELFVDKRDDTAMDDSPVHADTGSIVATMTDCEFQAQHATAMALGPEAINAVRLLSAFLKDVGAGNPGWLAKVVLQDYDQMNRAYIAAEQVIAKAKGIL